ncbi:hypothetical protein H0H93_006709 [Arthromyces matolae]|nr:hypothetical protein H0H93_006709 [Arthromyces matolae]
MEQIREILARSRIQTLEPVAKGTLDSTETSDDAQLAHLRMSPKSSYVSKPCMNDTDPSDSPIVANNVTEAFKALLARTFCDTTAYTETKTKEAGDHTSPNDLSPTSADTMTEVFDNLGDGMKVQRVEKDEIKVLEEQMEVLKEQMEVEEEQMKVEEEKMKAEEEKMKAFKKKMKVLEEKAKVLEEETKENHDHLLVLDKTIALVHRHAFLDEAREKLLTQCNLKTHDYIGRSDDLITAVLTRLAETNHGHNAQYVQTRSHLELIFKGSSMGQWDGDIEVLGQAVLSGALDPEDQQEMIDIFTYTYGAPPRLGTSSV